MRFTVFTPTFNRSKTLIRLYESLKEQTFCDFEWLIIDDGSKDDTKMVIEDLINSEPTIKVRYYYHENGGKHRAINLGLDLAEGEYFFIVDSDDYLRCDALALVDKWIENITNINKKFVGVSGLKGYSNGGIVGVTFNGDYVDCTSFEREKYGIYGDKSEVFNTSILKKYKFPVVSGENFMTEAIVWNRLARDGYLIRYYNEVIYFSDYLEDGLTYKIDKLFADNFEGYTKYVNEFLSYKTSLLSKIRMLIAYSYRGKIANKSYQNIAERIGLPPIVIILFYRFGLTYKKIKKNGG